MLMTKDWYRSSILQFLLPRHPMASALHLIGVKLPRSCTALKRGTVPSAPNPALLRAIAKIALQSCQVFPTSHPSLPLQRCQSRRPNGPIQPQAATKLDPVQGTTLLENAIGAPGSLVLVHHYWVRRTIETGELAALVYPLGTHQIDQKLSV